MTTNAGASSSAPAITATTSGSGTSRITACALLTPAQVAVLAGGAPGPGTELDHSDTYKTCRWNVGANAVNVAVILQDAGSRGFVHSAGANTPVTVAGLGDAASFATEANGAELIAGKGRFSISLSVDGPVAASAQAAMIGDVRQVLKQLDP